MSENKTGDALIWSTLGVIISATLFLLATKFSEIDIKQVVAVFTTTAIVATIYEVILLPGRSKFSRAFLLTLVVTLITIIVNLKVNQNEHLRINQGNERGFYQQIEKDR